MNDLTIYDQMFIIGVTTVLMVSAVYAGMFLKDQEAKEDSARRDVENAAHRAAVDGRQGYRKTDITI